MRLESLPRSGFCDASHLVFHKKVVWTGGPSCCFVLFVQTRKTMVCWHFMSRDALDDDKMLWVERQLTSLPGASAATFFLLPGADRDPDSYDIKPTCRTARFRPGMDLTASRRFLFNFLERFSWRDRLVVLEPPLSYRDVWVYEKGAAAPVAVSDEAFFAKSCRADAEKMV